VLDRFGEEIKMTLDKFLVRKLFGRRTAGVGMLVFMAVSLCCPSAVFAGAITLGSAQNFAVLGGAGIMVNGSGSVVSGNIGDYPYDLASITGFPAAGTLVNGIMYAADNNPGPAPGIADQAQIDENTAFSALVGLTSTANLAGVVLGSGPGATPGYSTLLPGVYSFPSTSAQVDGTLTLNFNGESNAEFVFQIGSTLTTGSSAAIVVEGGNSTDSIYWEVASSATLGSSTAFAGNILASASITLDSSASIVCGRALADTGSVTLTSTNLISDNCTVDNFSTGATDFGSNGFSGVASTTPEPGTFLLLCVGLAGVVQSKLRQRRGRRS
jgi:type VI secretion system secreted protein VgrG